MDASGSTSKNSCGSLPRRPAFFAASPMCWTATSNRTPIRVTFSPASLPWGPTWGCRKWPTSRAQPHCPANHGAQLPPDRDAAPGKRRDLQRDRRLTAIPGIQRRRAPPLQQRRSAYRDADSDHQRPLLQQIFRSQEGRERLYAGAQSRAD
jgi:hypothetical protein